MTLLLWSVGSSFLKYKQWQAVTCEVNILSAALCVWISKHLTTLKESGATLAFWV